MSDLENDSQSTESSQADDSPSGSQSTDSPSTSGAKQAKKKQKVTVKSSEGESFCILYDMLFAILHYTTELN